ncbi:anti-sigma factor domain-containing protein [Metabacillus arenae]|uniref:RsgI N-terminal anti-sigma domain-containing protein n=1 Tax=Metabacillus arenae TaxID=2771434 RepID=A0A926NGX3_9BACI|nr:anti-sigma factor domain-containing protein [Metabacillus arenae]MBD1380338.1 hypothetical protein [Metabacillus arenae]
MNRGVVVELNDEYVTLLTPDGQFMKAKNVAGAYQLGEERTFSPLIKKEKAFTRLFKTSSLKMGLLSAAVIFLFVFTLLPFLSGQKVYAYMTIDINPSFELAIDQKLEVIEIVALNEDGEQMLEKLSEWKHQSLSKVVGQIVSTSRGNGYMNEDNEILLSTVVSKSDNEQFKKSLQTSIKQMESSYEKEELHVETLQSDQETREKAKSEGISTGKYIKLHEHESSSKEENEEKEEVAPKEKEEPLIEENSDEEQKSKNDSSEKPQDEKNAPPKNDEKDEKDEKNEKDPLKEEQKEKHDEEKEMLDEEKRGQNESDKGEIKEPLPGKDQEEPEEPEDEIHQDENNPPQLEKKNEDGSEFHDQDKYEEDQNESPSSNTEKKNENEPVDKSEEESEQGNSENQEQTDDQNEEQPSENEDESVNNEREEN